MKMFKEEKTNKKMTPEEMKDKYMALYEYMANSRKPENMMAFGKVMTDMMHYLIKNKPDVADEMIQKLESIKWKNYLTSKEADTILSKMEPQAPWSYEQWKQVMDKHRFELCNEPFYNQYALFVTMCMKMSDSGSTLAKYIPDDKLFDAVHDLAVDSLTDKDGVFSIRKYFSV